MKIITNHKLRLLFLLPLVFLVFNCQKDDTPDDKVINQEETIQKIVTLDELRGLPQMAGRFSITKKDKDTLTKLYSAKYNFSIDLGRVMITQKGDYHSLSFPVIRKVPSGKLENLFLHPYNGGYLPYLMRYNFDAKDLLNLENGKEVDNILTKTEVIPLEDFDINNLGLKMETFGDRGGFGYSGIYWDGNNCWVFDSIVGVDADTGLLVLQFALYTGADCKPPTGDGSDTGLGPHYFMLVDLRSELGSSGSGGASSGGGSSGGPGVGTVWNPGGSSNPGNGSNPGFGNPLNGNPVIGVIGNELSAKSANAIEIEDEITSQNLDECSAAVLEQLKILTDKDIAKIITKLDANPSPYKLDIETQQNATFSNPAITTRRQNSSGQAIRFDYVMKLNPDYFGESTPDNPTKANKLFRATILIHEIIHAYFMSLIDDVATGVPGSVETKAAAFDAYVTKTFGPNSDASAHEVMAIKYVDIMARAIQEYNTGLPVQGMPEQVYIDLAWGGLSTAPVFDTTDVLTAEDRIRIRNRYGAESVNRPVEDQEPIGEPCK